MYQCKSKTMSWICNEAICLSLQDHYLTKRSDCKNCPIKQKCIGKSFEKRIAITVYKEEYERNNKRVRSKFGRYMKGKRQSAVEPVFGTLTQFMGLRKINTIGIAQANKVMHMSATAYNLKKLMKFMSKTAETMTKQAIVLFSSLRSYHDSLELVLRP